MREARSQCRWTAILVVCALAAVCFAQTPAAPPNIVLVMADDQGWGDVGFRGHEILQTPVLDEMAASGLRFDRFYSAAPVCSPTRASVLTGRHPNRMGCFQWGHTLRTDEVTIAEVLQKTGYATGHFGKWHLGSIRADSAVCPGKNGFDEWYSASNFYGNSPFFSHNGKVIQTKGEGSHVTVQLALEWMKKVKARPFCSVIWFGSPHNPHVGTEKYLSMYKGQPKGMAHFYAEITAMDTAIGELRAGLKKLGVASHTILWFCSDNGGLKPNSMGGLSGRKGKLLEGGIRVPAIIEWPSVIKSARVVSAPTCTTDIYPTVLELVGASVPEKQPILDGVSLAELVRGKEFQRSKPLGFWIYPGKGRGMRSDHILQALQKEQRAGKQTPAPPAGAVIGHYSPTRLPGASAWIDGDWKLHRVPNKRGENAAYTLFNLRSDLQEKKDVASGHPKRLAGMKAALAAWQLDVVRSLNGGDYE